MGRGGGYLLQKSLQFLDAQKIRTRIQLLTPLSLLTAYPSASHTWHRSTRPKQVYNPCITTPCFPTVSVICIDKLNGRSWCRQASRFELARPSSEVTTPLCKQSHSPCRTTAASGRSGGLMKSNHGKDKTRLNITRHQTG